MIDSELSKVLPPLAIILNLNVSGAGALFSNLAVVVGILTTVRHPILVFGTGQSSTYKLGESIWNDSIGQSSLLTVNFVSSNSIVDIPEVVNGNENEVISAALSVITIAVEHSILIVNPVIVRDGAPP